MTSPGTCDLASWRRPPKSNEAFALHSQKLAAKGADYMEFLEGPPEVVLLDEI
jgi:hypothetical protein